MFVANWVFCARAVRRLKVSILFSCKHHCNVSSSFSFIVEQIQSFNSPLIREKYVISLRHVGPSVGPSEVVRELTKDLEDVGEASVLSRDLLSISKSIHKPLIREKYVISLRHVGPSVGPVSYTHLTLPTILLV